MACTNGLLHLPTGKLLPHTPGFYGHNALAFPYDPGAPKPREWRKFLKQLWPNDRQARRTLQEITGYLLTADTKKQKIFLLLGPPRSGKGTIGKVITALLGKENVCAPTLASLETNFGLSSLLGKSLGIVGDARLGGRSDQAAITERLLSISGEDGITIDRKYKELVTVQLATRFLILTNELPRLNDASRALASRFIVLKLKESFLGREDEELYDKLLPELPGILNWAITGWKRLQKRGRFVQPKSSRQDIAELEFLSSPVSAFLADCCEVKLGHSESCEAVFDAWKVWCEKQGQNFHGNSAT